MARRLLACGAMPPVDSPISTFARVPDALHRRLAASHAARLSPRLSEPNWESSLQEELTCRRLARELVERERDAIAPLIRRVPTDPDGFVAWFEDLKQTGPGQGDELFPWIAEQASRDELRWFLEQEAGGEARLE